MVIGLDIDDTITDTLAVMMAYAQKFTIEDLGREIDIKEISNNRLDIDYVQDIHAWSREEELKFFWKYYRQMIEQTTPFFFAKEIISKLKEEGHAIILITARWDEVVEDGLAPAKEITETWLKKHGIEYDKLIVNAQNKGEIAKENNVDVFVDDSLKNCISAASKGIKTFIMDNRCNANSNAEGVTRVFSWPHLEHEIRKEIK